MMKKTVLDLADLQEMVPFFRTSFGTFIGKRAIKWLSVDKVNQVYANSCHLRGAAFTSGLLSDPMIDISYEIHNEEILDSLPEGAFVTVSNHPIGSLDGIILIDIFAKRRPDYKVMVNGVLTRIKAMGDNFISVEPDSEQKGGNLKNVNGVRASLARLKEGHPMGFFPAGGISSYHRKQNRVCDIPWKHSIIRLIRKTNVPVYPVYFSFYNSWSFYLLGAISWKIRTLRIPGEVFNKRGRRAHVYIGEPIAAEEIRDMKDDEELARFLYNKTYQAKKIK